MKYRDFGNTNEKISAVGLGCMGMSFSYGTPNDEESLKTLQLALDLGINYWDTADCYAAGKNEALISKVLKENRAKVFISTKFGFRYDEDGAFVDASPNWMRTAVEGSLKRLKTDYIDL